MIHIRSIRAALLVALFALSSLWFGAAAAAPFQDEFNTSTLGSGWTVSDGYALQHPTDTAHHASFGLTGSQLSVAFPGGREHNQWLLKHAQVVRPYPGSGVYEIKVDSSMTGDQQFGLVFQSNPSSFMMFMFYATDQVRAYVERFSYTGGQLYKSTVHGQSLGLTVPSAGSYYLRVTVDDAGDPASRNWKFEWSRNGSDWAQIVSAVLETGSPYENAGTIQQVGVFAGNQPVGFHGFDARFDYFRYYGGPADQPLPKPASLAARAGDQRVDLSWDAVPSADAYAVYVLPSGGGQGTQLGVTDQTRFAEIGTVNGVARRYAVAAIRGGLEGSSAEASAVPHASALDTLPSAGLLVALSASELAYTQSSGSTVLQWPNARGAYLSASSSGSAAPKLIHGAVDGQAAIRFDGVDDHFRLPGGFQDFTAGMSLYIVARPSLAQPGFKLMALGNGAGQQNVVLGRAGSSAGYQYFTDSPSGGVAWFNTPSGLVAGETSLVSVLQDGGATGGSSYADVSRNGASLFGQNVWVPPVTMRSVNYIGKSYWADGLFEGDIAEMILYNRKLGTQEQAAVRSYLNNKYPSTVNGASAPPLPAPTGVSATAGNGTVTLNWSAVGAANGYRVYRSTTSGGPYAQLGSTGNTAYADGNLSNGTAYHYVVRSYSTTQESANSPQVTATPEGQVAPLAAPAGFTGTAGNGTVSLSWNAVSGATGYRVLRAVGGGSYSVLSSTASTGLSDNSVSNGTTYQYAVRAYSASQESASSTPVALTPFGPDPALPSAGLLMVLDAQVAAAQYGNGAAVPLWQDASTRSNHAAASGSAMPVLVANAIGGKPALRFDGVNDHLTLPGGFQDFRSGMSLYVVMRPTVLQTGFKVLALGNGPGQHNVVLGRAGSTSGYQFFTDSGSGAVGWFNTTSGLVAGEAALVSVLQDAGAVGSTSYAEVGKNGQPLSGQTVWTPPVTNRVVNYIGRSYWAEGLFQGDIAEVLLYNRKLSAQEQAEVRAYIAAKYALPVAP